MQPKVPPWPICFGLETEIGISVVENPDADVVEESIELVRSAAKHGLPHLWDYATEDPHQDARGFRAPELLQDSDEAHYFSQDNQRELSFLEIKSDLVLRNGARFYNDHAHPEYSTPECAMLRELVAQDKAGERILEECARQVTRHGRRTVRLYKNNTDFRGHSYGCHDNYLIPRAIPWDRLVSVMTPFLVTRQLYAGAGKVGFECEDSALGGGFQISQRADFFSELVSIDTMNRRPLINTRDEPHADLRQFRRFHVIVGDANLAQFATWLKVGTTALVLESITHEAPPAAWSLADPLQAHRDISRDESFRWELRYENGRAGTALELQWNFVNWVENHVDLAHPEKKQVFQDWKDTLTQLETAPLDLRDRLDWPAKRFLLETFRESENLQWSDRWLQSIDLEYHLLDRHEGLFFTLESSGQMRQLVAEGEIIHAIQQPPVSTRAYIRGKCVQRFSPNLHSVQWDSLVLRCNDKLYRVDLGQAFPGGKLEAMASVLDQSYTVEEFIRRMELQPS